MPEEALSAYRAASTAAEDAGLLNSLGIALKALDDLESAAASFERAIQQRPGFVDGLYNLAAARKDEGRTDEAVTLLRQVVALAPDLAAARFALCMAHIPPLYRDAAEVEQRRADYAAELMALEAYAERADPKALATGVGAAQPFQLAYQGRSDVDLQRRYGGIVCRAMAQAFPPAPLAEPPSPGERLRVGIVCGQLRDHSVWRLPTRGWVEGLDRRRFELIAFHTGQICDAETDRACGLFDRFVQGPLPLAEWRDRVVDAAPHVLIYPEIGMDPMAARLAALRLAPAQYASWGHPSTTGYPTIDYYLSSDAMEPADGQAHYTETLVRLPGLSTPFVPPPAVAPIPARASLGLLDDQPVYWCGQSLFKYLPQHDAVFVEIAAQVPDARFVFVEYPGSLPLTERFRGRLAEVFSARGLDAERSCVILPRLAPAAFRAAMGCADVMLDSIGWSGCNSLLDALTHALPIVTVPGPFMRGRHAAAILDEMGLRRFVCADEVDYVEAAVRLGIDPAAREAFRAAIVAALPRLSQTSAIPALEAHLTAACQSGPP